MIMLNKILESILSQNKYKLYCDMDGVLVDFEKGYEDLTKQNIRGQYIKGDNDFWKPIKDAGYKFWSNLEWMSDGKQLWDYIKQYNPKLLTAPSREESSRIGKQKWVNKHIPGTPIIFKKAEEKKDLATPTSVLIDDREDNIQKWIDAGGIGIHHTSTLSTIKELQKLKL